MPSLRVNRRMGFSLTELLVVLAIVALLAALIFPVFAAVRRRSHMAACSSNLHQVGLALGMYYQDWGVGMPTVLANGSYSWAAILPYTKSTEVTHCPFYWRDSDRGTYVYKRKLYDHRPKLDSQTFVAYCAQHLNRVGNGIDLYGGSFIAVKGDGSAQRVDASQTSRWLWIKGKWVREEESHGAFQPPGDWGVETRFPGEPWPPEWD